MEKKKKIAMCVRGIGICVCINGKTGKAFPQIIDLVNYTHVRGYKTLAEYCKTTLLL